jgi:hypothetical protein
MITVAHSEFQTLLHLSSRFIVTSQFLFERFASKKTDLLNPPYIEQSGDLAHFANLNAISIEYHGTQAHRNDLSAIAPALNHVHDAYPQVRFKIFMGDQTPLKLRGRERIEIHDSMLWDDYKAMVKVSRAHIAIAPMLHTPYNRAKSFVKIHDHARLGAVGIYSNRPPFRDVVTHGLDGFLLENDQILWRNTLTWLVKHPEELKQRALAGQALARRIGDLKNAEKYWRGILTAKGSL